MQRKILYWHATISTSTWSKLNFEIRNVELSFTINFSISFYGTFQNHVKSFNILKFSDCLHFVHNGKNSVKTEGGGAYWFLYGQKVRGKGNKHFFLLNLDGWMNDNKLRQMT